MKQIIISIVAVLLISTTAIAQDNQGNRPERRQIDQKEMIQRRTDEMVKRYGLNKEQAKELLSLNTKMADKMRPLRGMRSGGRGMGRGGQGTGRGGQRMGRGNRFQRQQGDSLRLQRPQQRRQGDSLRLQRPQQRQQMRPQMTKEMIEQQKAYEGELQKILTPEQFKAYQADEKQRQQQFGSQRGSQRGPQMEPQGDNKADKQAEKKADSKADKKADKKEDKKTDKKSGKKSEKKSDNKSEKKSDKKSDNQEQTTKAS